MAFMITELLEKARCLAGMGAEERRKAFLAGRPVVYSSTPDGTFTTEYPDGKKVYSVPQIRDLPRK